MRSMRRDDVPLTIEAEGVEVRTTAFGGDQNVSFVRLAAGTDLGPLLKGLPYHMCPCPHWGYMISGRLRMSTSQGHFTYVAGDAFYWAPGHSPEALEDTEYVDFAPSVTWNKVLEHLKETSTQGSADSA